MLGSLASWAERKELINNAGQLSITNLDTDSKAEHLLDNNPNTAVHSTTGDLSGACSITVRLNKALTLADNEDLVVFLQRCGHNESDSHPTIFQVEGSTDGSTWDETWDTGVQSCHIYFLYRGPNTKEYSTRIHTSKHFTHLRFTVIANSGRKYDSAGHRYMGLSEFQIIQLGRDDNYSDSQIDRFHLTTDYFTRLKDYSFENTQGILDERNRKGGRNDISGFSAWCDWNSWSNGIWTKDRDALAKAGVQMPDYTMLTSENDGEHGYKPDAGQQRQPTHVTEHILYAIPGDAIALYPYYSFTIGTNYLVNFAHWYDYQSGGHLTTNDATTGAKTAMLDFLIDPSAIHKNDTYGYFAGKDIGEISIKISTPEEYIAYAKAVNENNLEAWKLKAQIVADLNFAGYTNVPSLGKYNYYGTLEGNGHTISNLVMNRPDEEGVGLVHNAGNDAIVRNLIIDETCSFIGKDKVAALYAQETQGNGRRIDNIQTYATVEATDGQAAALIGGKGDQYTPEVVINNCYVGGIVKGKKVAAVAIWDNLKLNNTISNTTVQPSQADATVKFVESSKATLNNCYGDYTDIDSNNRTIPTDPTTLGDGWENRNGYDHIVPKIIISDFEPVNSNYGKIATFFCPRSPYDEGGTLQSLPFRPGEDEFIISADFSQSFDAKYNLENNTIVEPIIQFRHIFRIRDGKTFAEEFSGSPEQNKEYIRKNLRRVSTRAGVPFQIRLDSPIPQKGTTRSKYYYKISPQDYRRVCTMDLEVIDLSTNQVIQKVVIEPETGTMKDENGNNLLGSDNLPVNNAYFYYGEEFNGEGSRQIDGITYNICGGGGKYYRMLKCENPAQGRYLLRAIGNDINGNNIKIYNSTEPLVVMEMELTVLPEEAACVVSDKDLYSDNTKYAYAQEENLEKAYGAPKQRLTFDEYAALEDLTNKSDYLLGNSHKYKYKWPTLWNEVTYSFDYNETRNYNMYTIASHCSQTPYQAAASKYINPDNSTGLYDRLYYKTTRLGQQPPKYGYFYYVNASADPGVMAKLRLEDLCMGSTVHVSAWVAEFSAEKEVANISFNFVAVLNEANGKERIPLHSFVSGYVPKQGEWINIYYSFIPNYTEAGLNPGMIDHYELELDNNCKNSESADYAVDNIRLYVASPVIYATQNEPICDPKVTALDVRIESPFDALLQVIGKIEDKSDKAETVNLYYTFIDKKKFDEAYKKHEGDSNPGELAYNESVLKYDYATGKEGTQSFGQVSFSLNFSKNPIEETTQLNTVYGKTEDDGTRLIVFNTRPSDNSMLTPGKEYYVSMVLDDGTPTEITNPGWTEFDITSECARMCVFRVKPSSTIKIDGEVREDADNITCCENLSPIVQVDLLAKDSGDTVEKNARMDWYDGRYADFAATKYSDALSLSDVLTMFRNEFPDAEDFEDALNEVEKKDYSGDLYKDMIEYLKGLTEPQTITTGGVETKRPPLLYLSQTSFVFRPVTIPEGEDYADCYVVAIPINTNDGETMLCTQPTEVRIRVEQVAPELRHGIALIDYPEYMTDVPLRIGLRQLKSVSAQELPIADDHLSLRIPLHIVKTATEGINAIKAIKNNPYISLVETNDPEYKDLGTTDKDDNDTGTLMAVGEIRDLEADATRDNKTDEANSVKVVFYGSFNFKEGYYYRMRFMFEEQNNSATETEVCSGQDIFTIKVVPEYQRWTGKAGTNWNNDENWERVSSGELYLQGNRKTEMTDYVTDTDDGNSRTQSYAPLNFTKAIIPSGEVFPHLAGYADDNTQDFSNYYPTVRDIDYPTPYNGRKVIWLKKPTADDSNPATDDIQFDMVASRESNSSGNPTNNYLRCRPWYANACEQIHFRPNSEILGQQNLIYQKAWVDIATKPGRWYTLASPLQTVYAGDLYLPSSNARQETELFTEMTFDFGTYNRFKPAVYQRGWNKSKTTVYEIKDGPNRNVAVKADWSNVYNDVTEAYGKGTGFSIKTDISKMDTTPDEVVFRLPKSDTSFYYYSEDYDNNGNGTSGNQTGITRGAHSFKLNIVNPITTNNTIKARSAGDNRYFLVGNPLMAHLDMQEFFKINSEKIQPKYWILTEGSQKVAVFDEACDGFVGSATGYVAPLQGFFVEAKDNATNKEDGDMVLDLHYNADMACIRTFEDSPLRIGSRSGYDHNMITISAVRDHRTISQTFINLSLEADKGYNENLDAVLIDNSQLDIPASVYTVGGNKALSVNSTDTAEGTEIGLIASDDSETRLVFEGVDCLGDMALYDTETERRTPLYDGMEYTVKGSVAGRLYLTSGDKTVDDALHSIKVNVKDRHVRIDAGAGNAVAARVYTVEGIMVMNPSVDSTVLEFDLGSGVYIMEVTDGVETVTRKILVL